MVEYDYKTVVERDCEIRGRLLQFRPDLAFLGAAHSARLYRDRGLLSKEGIIIDEYWEDDFKRGHHESDYLFASSMSSKHISVEDVLHSKMELELKRINSPDETQHDYDLVHLERCYHALKKGRITDGKPDYIGTWDLDFEHKGLFEIYVTKSSPTEDGMNIEGIIEDCFGTAEFTGKIEPKGITFVKKYCKNIKYEFYGKSVTTDPITYSGFLNKNNEFVGTYQGIHCRMGNFRMRKAA